MTRFIQSGLRVKLNGNLELRTVETGFETKPYLRIRRINPKNGRQMSEHFEQRAPLDVQFDKNSIQVVFKKEVEVLKYLTF